LGHHEQDHGQITCTFTWKAGILRRSAYISVLFCILLAGCAQERPATSDSTGWISLFNGEDLSGWTPKFSGHPAGMNYRNTFVAENGILRVSYTQYDSFRNEFGHLFHNKPYTHYLLSLDYRFTEPVTPGAPAWAIRNNGIMIFSQSAESMDVDQNFPVSVEVQLLGGTDPATERPTGNLCTPGTHVFMNGGVVTEHCTPSSSGTFYDDRWIHLEVAVLPDGRIYHIVAGDTVFAYSQPVVGGDFLPEDFAMKEGDRLSGGYIAIQAESHPTEFRNIRIKVLE
jgi:hypothetical protein